MSKTLFVRNISYDTNQDDFSQFFQRFGPLKYAVLCKNKESAEDAHKGTGFVQFREPLAAEKLIELSK